MFRVGDNVTNQKWIGVVIGVHTGWVWVLPIGSRDGPLTFRQSDLELAK